MKLQFKTHLMISLVVIAIIVFLSIVINRQNQALLENQMGSAAMDMAYSVSYIHEIPEALAEKKQDGSIQTLVAPLMENTRYQYIIIMDMESVQYSYPYESGLYKPYKNGGEDQVLNQGKAYISADTNELLSAIRAFHPIFYKDKQVGAVLVGLLTDDIQRENMAHQRTMETALVIGVLAGIVAAYFFAVNIKKAIFGLEPKEIAILLSQKEMILQSIERGIIAVDEKGEVIMANNHVNKWLEVDEIESASLQKKSKVLYDLHRQAMLNHEMVVNATVNIAPGKKVLVNICMIKSSKGEVIGTIISLEDFTMVRTLAESLTDYKSLVDSLRAQNHEFMNKLQVLSGMIQLEKYDEAMDYIDDQTHQRKNVHMFMTEQIKDAKIAGLLLSKYENASEKRIDFVVDSESYLYSLPAVIDADDVCTILGNLIDNSIEALSESKERQIDLYIVGNDKKLEIIIENTGPYIRDNDILNQGYSTKGKERGYGLYNVKQIVDAADGSIYWLNGEGVEWHVTI